MEQPIVNETDISLDNDKNKHQFLTFMLAGEEYGVDFKRFHYDAAVRKIADTDALNDFKYYRLSEILLSNQRRLLMWLFHCRFGKWYTPKS